MEPVDAATFVSELGPAALVRATRSRLPVLSDDAATFLTEIGLPRHVQLGPADLRSVLSFERLAAPLECARDASDRLPGIRATDWVIGEEVWRNGGAWWVLRATSDEILRIDLEATHSVARVAVSLAGLATVMVALRRWSCGRIDLDSLASVMRRAAPRTDPDTIWAALLELLPDEGSDAFRVLTTAPDLSPR